jgi:DNA-binding XRE family transcriptional regulator
MTVYHKPAPAPCGESFGEYVKRVREFRGLTKMDLTRAMQVNYSTVSRIENGDTAGKRMKERVLKRLSLALSVPLEYLRSALSEEAIPEGCTINKVCPCCWTPGGKVDSRWGMVDVKFCMFCGKGLLSDCTGCGEPLNISGKFCSECGKDYRELE